LRTCIIQHFGLTHDSGLTKNVKAAECLTARELFTFKNRPTCLHLFREIRIVNVSIPYWFRGQNFCLGLCLVSCHLTSLSEPEENFGGYRMFKGLVVVPNHEIN